MRKLIYILLLLFIISCNHSSRKISSFEISDFNPLSNYSSQSKGDGQEVKLLYFDYTDAIDSGFVAPTVQQTQEGVFISKFKIKNKSGKNEHFYYKLYYQNESYKFPEVDSISKKYNNYASENFYGSYENNLIGFKQTTALGDGETKEIFDSIRIVGNPRDEKIFFTGSNNDRWKRNPRVGNYSFLLVVLSEENFLKSNIPSFVIHINEMKDSSYINPYYYYLFGEGAKNKELLAAKANTQLKVIAKPDPGAGIYVSPLNYNKEEQQQYFCSNCGMDEPIYKTAAFQQFLNGVDPNNKIQNIPLNVDVIHDNYSKRDYNRNKAFTDCEKLITIAPTVAKHPCQTVFSDSVKRKIILKNPKSEVGSWKKESVGTITRHGLTYGKWRAKVKLTQLLNKDNVWNGLTNAIWLIVQPDVGDWNLRRPCEVEGYVAGYGHGKDRPRVRRTSYSEIDFEILKTVPYCPDITFPPVYKRPIADSTNEINWNVALPPDVLEHDGDITVACTNWDMTCREPKNYNVGCHSVYYQGKEYQAHRWDHWYSALTEKSWQNDDELFGSNYYYFEIDWQPDKIIWRLGPEPDKMKIVGYEDYTISSIPNNQMLMIFTQEWHNTKWWPGSPYDQENIPFPKNDIVGEIYEVVVE